MNFAFALLLCGQLVFSQYGEIGNSSTGGSYGMEQLTFTETGYSSAMEETSSTETGVSLSNSETGDSTGTEQLSSTETGESSGTQQSSFTETAKSSSFSDTGGSPGTQLSSSTETAGYSSGTQLSSSTGTQLSSSTETAGSSSGTQLSSSTETAGYSSGAQLSSSTETAGYSSGTQLSSSTETAGYSSGTQLSSSTETAGYSSGTQLSSSTETAGYSSGTQPSSSTETAGSSSGTQQSNSTETAGSSSGTQQSSSTETAGSSSGTQQSTGTQQSSSTETAGSSSGTQQSTGTGNISYVVALNDPTATYNIINTLFTTVIIQNAINDATANGGGTIYIKPGNYIINQNIEIFSNITIIGSHQDKTIISENFNSIQKLGLFRMGLSNNIIISDITLNGNNNSFVPYGIYIKSCIGVNLINVTVMNFQQDGIIFMGSAAGFAGKLNVSNCFFGNNSRNGLSVLNATCVEITDSQAYGNLENGFSLSSVENFIIRACVAELNGMDLVGSGYAIRGNSQLVTNPNVLDDNFSYNNKKNGIYIETVENIVISNNNIIECMCFDISNSTNVQLLSNACRGNVFNNVIQSTISNVDNMYSRNFCNHGEKNIPFYLQLVILLVLSRKIEIASI